MNDDGTYGVTDGVFLPFLRTAYNYDRNAVSDETGLLCLDPSLAKQEFAEEVDINTIIRRFNVGGDLPQNVRAPTYGDFTGIDSFQEAVNAIASANESFDAMPAAVRARFNNDPAAFVAFCSDADNLAEMKKLGLTDPALDDRLPVPANAGLTGGVPNGEIRSGAGTARESVGSESIAATARGPSQEL